jgi:hypothetical protein
MLAQAAYRTLINVREIRHPGMLSQPFRLIDEILSAINYASRL